MSRFFGFVFAVLFSSFAWSAIDGLSLPHEKYRLDNSLEVILQHDDRIPFVAISMWVHVGATSEKPGKTGFAHLFEHLMFEGSKHVGDNYIPLLEAAGATTINGTTSFDRTNYFSVVPKNELELVLWMDSDRLGWLLDTLTQNKLDEQRGVVKNERLQRYDNQPYGKVSEKAWQTLFAPEHPFYGMVIGSLKDLDNASLDDVKTFFRTYYSPANVTLTIVGDFDQATIKDTIKTYFASLLGPSAPKRVKAPFVKPQQEIRLVEEEPLGKLTQVQVQYITPGLFKAGDADLDVLSHLLTGDKAGRLNRALLIDRQLVQSVSASQSSYGDLSVFSIEALLQEGVKPDDVLKIIDDEMAQIANNPASPQEIARAVRTIQTNQLFQLQKIGGGYGRTEQLQAYNHYLGNPDSLQADLARYDAVTSKTISDAINQHLKTQNRVVLFAIPKSAKKGA